MSITPEYCKKGIDHRLYHAIGERCPCFNIVEGYLGIFKRVYHYSNHPRTGQKYNQPIKRKRK